MLPALEAFWNSKAFPLFLFALAFLSFCLLLFSLGVSTGYELGKQQGYMLASGKVVEKDSVITQYVFEDAGLTIIYDPRTPGKALGIDKKRALLHVYNYSSGKFEHELQDLSQQPYEEDAQ